MSTGARTDPYLDFRFLVEIESLIVGGFSEVTGLEQELTTEEYEEGGVNTHTHTLRSRVTHPNLVLRRGVTDSRSLWEWLQRSAAGPVDRKAVRLFLQDSTGEAAAGWGFSDAYPVKWSGPDFSAERGSVAIESLELTHTGITRLEGF